MRGRASGSRGSRKRDRVAQRAGDPRRHGRRRRRAHGRRRKTRTCSELAQAARRHAPVAAARLSQPLARPDGVDDRRGDRGRRGAVPGVQAHRARPRSSACSGSPRCAAPFRPARRRSVRRRARPADGRPVTETGLAARHRPVPRERAAADAAGVGALRAPGARGRRLQLRPSGARVARAAAGAGRRARWPRTRCRASTSSLAEHRGTGGRRRDHRGRRRPWTFGIDVGDLRRVAARDLGAAEAAAAGGRGAAELQRDRRRLPVPQGSAGADRDLPLDTNAMVFGMPSALFPAIALHRLHGNATTVGYSLLPRRRPVRSCARSSRAGRRTSGAWASA